MREDSNVSDEKGAISRRVSRKRLNVPLTEIFLDRYRIQSLLFLIKLLRGLFISKNNSKKSLERDTWKRNYRRIQRIVFRAFFILEHDGDA